LLRKSCRCRIISNNVLETSIEILSERSKLGSERDAPFYHIILVLPANKQSELEKCKQIGATCIAWASSVCSPRKNVIPLSPSPSPLTLSLFLSGMDTTGKALIFVAKRRGGCRYKYTHSVILTFALVLHALASVVALALINWMWHRA